MIFFNTYVADKVNSPQLEGTSRGEMHASFFSSMHQNIQPVDDFVDNDHRILDLDQQKFNNTFHSLKSTLPNHFSNAVYYGNACGSNNNLSPTTPNEHMNKQVYYSSSAPPNTYEQNFCNPVDLSSSLSVPSRSGYSFCSENSSINTQFSEQNVNNEKRIGSNFSLSSYSLNNIIDRRLM